MNFLLGYLGKALHGRRQEFATSAVGTYICECCEGLANGKPVVLYGCETWSLTLREKHRLRVFENTILRRMIGPKREEDIVEKTA
jgi:hypothetical protein